MLLKEQSVKNDHAQAILQTQIEIQEQTLKTIAQEIHDNVGQVLSLAKLNLNTLDFETGASRQQKIDKSIELVSKAVSDLRDLSRSFHGEKIEELALADTLEHELKIISNTGLFSTSFTQSGNVYPLQNQVKIVIFRIVQESLSNAIKHSKGKHITVQMNYEPEEFTINVRDDGQGFNLATLDGSKTGIGLKNMQNRAKLINAFFSIESIEGQGTKTTIKTNNKIA